MTARHAVLSIGAALVLGFGVYLFMEVRAQPAGPGPAGPAGSDRRAPAIRRTPVAQQTAAPPESTDPAAPSPVLRGTPAAAMPGPAARGAAPAPAAPPVQDEPLVGAKLDAALDEANHAYDRGDYEDAKMFATRLLARFPTNVRMLRIMVSAACIDGDNPVAQAHYARLPPSDQEQMKIRCARYGIVFPDRP